MPWARLVLAARELDDEAVRGAAVFVEQREAALRESAEIVTFRPADLCRIGRNPGPNQGEAQSSENSVQIIGGRHRGSERRSDDLAQKVCTDKQSSLVICSRFDE